jgi:plastocyanin
MRIRYGLALALLAFGVAACAPEDEAPATAPTASVAATEPATEAAAEPVTLPVQVDGSGEDFTAAYLNYFPKDVTVRPGDTVKFSLVETGEPHTVTFGQLIEDSQAKSAELGPEMAMEDPAVQKVPVLLPDGPGDAVQSAAQPCYLATGEPGTEACSEADQVQTDFNGTQSYYNSGWMTADEPFSVTFADDIKPGKYTYICLLHAPSMAGTVTVVEPGTDIPTAAEVTADAEAEQAALYAELKPVYDATLAAAKPGEVMAGTGSPEQPSAMALTFIPESVSIKAGEAVSWTVIGPHTITFNPPADAMPLRLEDSTGVHVNQVALAPADSPGMPPPPEAEANAPTPDPNAPTPDPNSPPPPPIVIDGGTWDGTGYHSSGAILSFPPQLFAYKLAFSEPGTYPYVCTIHPGMTGTVTVQ